MGKVVRNNLSGREFETVAKRYLHQGHVQRQGGSKLSNLVILRDKKERDA
jgi:hypothetical protein